MFYSQFILAKKGPLGTIWIAAHLERKLRKNQVADTDIGVSVDSILSPDVPIALRLSSHLLLGVVRIYSRKVNYLFDDCSEALLKIRQAFRSTAVDLPPEESTAPYHSITLPETFDLDDFELPDNDIFQGNYVDHHISSRDQITLQDTMDGVVYSTSQFGLDERFGDGDTSGLDLDEELFLSKVAAAGHDDLMFNSGTDPQSSVQPMASFNHEENNEMTDNSGIMITSANKHIEENDGDTYHIEYDQAPCTPGLLEEPNLSNIQETSAYDDHLEFENQNLTEFAVKENMENAPINSELYLANKNEVNDSLGSGVDHVPVLFMSDNDNSFLANDLESSKKDPQGELSTVESLLLVNPDSPFTISSALGNQVGAISLKNDSSDKTCGAPSIPDGVEDMQNGIVSNNKPHISFDDKTCEDCLEFQGVRLGEINIGTSNLYNTCQPVSEVVLKNNGTPYKTELSNNVEIAGDTVQYFLLSDAFKSNAKSNDTSEHGKSETQDKPEKSKDMLESGNSVLENVADTEYTNQIEASFAPNLPSQVAGSCLELLEREDYPLSLKLSTAVQGEEYHEDDGSKQVVEGNHLSALFPCGKLNDQAENVIAVDSQLETINGSVCSDFPAPEKLLSVPEVDAHNLSMGATPGQMLFQTGGVVEGNHLSALFPCDKLNDQAENVIAVDSQLETINGSVCSDFPAPEKLLSVPEVYAHNNLSMGETPGQMFFQTGGGNDTGITVIGKKRSFTESALTMQSLNSVDSLAIVRRKTTPESVPKDDDLLSSILVGRKSSALKVKETPQQGLPYLKRHKSAPRASASKRKVLMDEMMVLHGDMIRQQLTNTEDIRRLRKKAPCTRPEIFMIQKQLEDDIFSETIFTGVSLELASMHNQTYDLSETRISLDDVTINNASSGVDRSITSLKDKADTFFEAAKDMDLYDEFDSRVARIGGGSNIMEGRVNDEAQPAGTPVLMGSRQGDGQSVSLDPTFDVAEAKNSHELRSETNEMDDAVNPDATVVVYSSSTVDVIRNGAGDQTPVLMGSRQGDGQSVSLDPTFDVVEAKNSHELRSETNEMDVDAVNPDATVVVYSSSTVDVIRNGAGDQTAGLLHLADDISSEVDASSQSKAPVETTDQQLDVLSVENYANADADKKDCDVDVSVVPDVEMMEEIPLRELETCASVQVEAEIQAGVAHTESVYQTTNMSLDMGGCSTHILSDEHVVDEASQNEQALLEEDMFLYAEAEYNAKNLETGGGYDAEDITYSSGPVTADVDLRNSTHNGDTEEVDTDQVDYDNLDYSAAGNDTEFLNYDDDDDDDEVAEADDEDVPNAEEAHFIDNSGWSSRTRAVAKYLQTLFDKEAERKRNVLLIDNILAGKSRKEASRMFFETLVLKTKDYIHVEQTAPFNNINILPRAKLTKVDF